MICFRADLLDGYGKLEGFDNFKKKESVCGRRSSDCTHQELVCDQIGLLE